MDESELDSYSVIDELFAIEAEKDKARSRARSEAIPV